MDTRKWIAVAGTMLGAFMAVLDIQITNASLNDISGGISVTPDEGIVDLHELPHRRDHHHPAHGLVHADFHHPLLPAGERGALPDLLRRCAASRPASTEMIVFRAGQGFTGGVFIPTALDGDHHLHAAQPPGGGASHVRVDGHARARGRPVHRRPAHRQRGLAMELLHQFHSWRHHVRHGLGHHPGGENSTSNSSRRETGSASARWPSAWADSSPCWRKASARTGSAAGSSGTRASWQASSCPCF